MRYETASLLLAGLGDATGAVGPYRHQLRFRGGNAAGLAYDDLPAVLRCRCAVYSGFAMVITLAVPIRKFYHLEDMITTRHLDNMAKGHADNRADRGLRLRDGIVHEHGSQASHWEYFAFWNRMFGPMGWSYWVLITCNIAIPQLMWLRSVRVSPTQMFLMSIVVNTGMWFERFVIVVTSLYRDYLPSSWGTYRATRWDYATFIGTHGPVHVPVLPVRALPAHDSHV